MGEGRSATAPLIVGLYIEFSVTRPSTFGDSGSPPIAGPRES